MIIHRCYLAYVSFMCKIVETSVCRKKCSCIVTETVGHQLTVGGL